MKYIKQKKIKKDCYEESLLAQIKNELREYPIDFIVEFIKIYPDKDEKYKIPIRANDKIIIKGRSVGATTYINSKEPFFEWNGCGTILPKFLHLPIKYLSFSSIEDFWQRWNRFKKLKIFL